MVLWPPPNKNRVALNVDGNSSGNPGRAVYGGLIRDHTGSWIRGFSGHIIFADSIEAELIGIMNGLIFAWELGYQDVSCRSNCMVAISLIQDSTSQPHKYVELTDSIKELMSRDWAVSLVHTLIEKATNVRTLWRKWEQTPWINL